jgi:hypothetical protein
MRRSSRCSEFRAAGVERGKPERLGSSKKAPLSPQDLTTACGGEETLAICRALALARAVFAAAIAKKPAGRFMIRSRTRVVQRHPEGYCR